MTDAVSVETLLPHRPPMLMVSELVSTGEAEIHCQLSVSEDNPFLKDGVLPGFVCLELLAQSCGIFLGLRGLKENAPAQRSGAIVNVRDMRVAPARIIAGDLLDVKADFLGGNMQAAMFYGQVFCGDSELFAAKVTVAALGEDDGK